MRSHLKRFIKWKGAEQVRAVSVILLPPHLRGRMLLSVTGKNGWGGGTGKLHGAPWQDLVPKLQPELGVPAQGTGRRGSGPPGWEVSPVQSLRPVTPSRELLPSGQLFSQESLKQMHCLHLVTTQPFPWCPSEKAGNSASPGSIPPARSARETLLEFPHSTAQPCD